jgi:phenylacetic acid degradation operon negative regulatory protein
MSVNAVTRSLVEEFRSRPTLRAGSLITTVFGDAVAPRGGTVWIGSLIRVMDGFGISERLVRTSVFRLSRDGWLDVRQAGRRSYYSLKAEGAEKFAQATQRIYGEPVLDWSGDWCLVLLSGLEAALRESVRKELSWQGFGTASTSLMLHPAPKFDDLKSLLNRLGVEDKVVIINGRTLDETQVPTMRDLVHLSWNLGDIDERYARFAMQFRPVYAAVRKSRRIAPEDAFRIRTLLIQEYRKILLRDPMLPAAMLPEDWHGGEAYQLCRNLYREIFEAADQYIAQTMETADGPLPPPSPDFYKRFGGLR